MKVAILKCKPVHASLYVTSSWSHKECISKFVACQSRIFTLFSMCISYFFLSHSHFWCSQNTFPLCNASCCCFFQQCPLSSHLDSIDGAQLRAWHCAKGRAQWAPWAWFLLPVREDREDREGKAQAIIRVSRRGCGSPEEGPLTLTWKSRECFPGKMMTQRMRKQWAGPSFPCYLVVSCSSFQVSLRPHCLPA